MMRSAAAGETVNGTSGTPAKLNLARCRDRSACFFAEMSDHGTLNGG
jgi:hypothetical protein